MTEETAQCYADRDYDAKYIGNYLRNSGIACCISYKTNSGFVLQKNTQDSYNKIRYTVERFFAWLKCGFRRTAIRYERISENYLCVCKHCIISDVL